MDRPACQNEILYRLNPAVSLHWAHWGSEHVVFDETSGQTHLMEPLRALVLDLLGDGSQSFDAILTNIAATAGLESSQSPTDLVAPILEELEVAGLVEALSA